MFYVLFFGLFSDYKSNSINTSYNSPEVSFRVTLHRLSCLAWFLLTNNLVSILLTLRCFSLISTSPRSQFPPTPSHLCNSTCLGEP